MTVEALASGRTGVARGAPDGRFEIAVEAVAEEVVLTFTKTGFEPEVVRVRPASEPRVIDVTLRLAAVNESTVVTATRTRSSTAQLAGSVSVFDEADIRARGSRSLSEVLQQVPGLQIEATGREGALTSLFARGGESDYNLVLINGVRVTLPGGRFDFGRVDASQIERVEVVRGSQSALYGSEAMGAVVQVFTRGAETGPPLRAFGSLEGGSFGTVRASGGFSVGAPALGDVHVSTSYRDTDGAFAARLPEKDVFNQRSFDIAGRALLGRAVQARSSVRYGKGRGRSVGQVAYGLFDTGTYYDTRDVSVEGRLSHTAGSRFRHEVSVGAFDYENLTGDRVGDSPWSFYGLLTGTIGALYPNSPRLVRQLSRAEFDALLASGTLPGDQFLASRPAIADFPSTSQTDAERRSFRYQADWTWAPGVALTGGFEYDKEEDPNVAFLKRSNKAAFLQQQFGGGGRWFATAGVRLDDNSRFGTAWSPKLSLGGFVVPYRRGAVSSLKVHGNIGRGIKNPVFAELYSAFVDGNPTLDPERATTIDLGSEVTFDDQRFALVGTYFRNRYRDQVAFRSTGPGLDGLPDYINVEGSKADGVEVELRLQRSFAGLTASAFYTYVDTQVTTTVSTSQQFQPGQPLLRRPRHAANLFASWAGGPVTLNASVRFVGQRHDAAFLSLTTPALPGRPARAADVTINPGYAVLAVNGEYRVGTRAGVFVRIDNMADKAYESALGFSGLPRSVSAGVRFDVARRRP